MTEAEPKSEFVLSTFYIAPLYGAFIMRILKKINRVITAPHCILRFIHTVIVHSLLLKLYIWWRHQTETFSALLAICAGNSPVTGEFPAQRSVTRNFGVCFDLRLNKRLSKQSLGWWLETPSHSLWRHCNVVIKFRFRWVTFHPWLIRLFISYL